MAGYSIALKSILGARNMSINLAQHLKPDMPWDLENILICWLLFLFLEELTLKESDMNLHIVSFRHFHFS